MNAPTTTNPFRHLPYTLLWSATLIATVSLWMQNVAAAWLLTSMQASPFAIALLQTATTLPTFLFGLPTGVMADLLNRRVLLLTTHSGMFLTALALALTTGFDAASVSMLLALTFALGTFSAVAITARQASVSDVVPREALMGALAWNNISYNASRAIGPALAGIVMIFASATTVFALNAVLFAVTIALQLRMKELGQQRAATQEPPVSAMLAGLRYVRHAPLLRNPLVRVVVFVTGASGLWALMPVVASERLGFGAQGYALLLGSLGAGAIASGLVLNLLRRKFSMDRLATRAGMLFAASTLALAFAPSVWIAVPSMAFSGVAWVVNNSAVGTTVQFCLPAWVRARALSVYLLTFQGSMAMGAAIWGAVANRIGVVDALIASAIATALGLLATSRLDLTLGDAASVTQAPVAELPRPANIADAGTGPLLVQVDYRVKPEAREAFLAELHRLASIRKRNGARRWNLRRDKDDPNRFIERFTAQSWNDYERQRARWTLADVEAEQRLSGFLHESQAVATPSFTLSDAA